VNQFDIIQSHERYEHADIFRLGDGLHQFWLKQLQKESGGVKKIWLKFDPYHKHVIQTEHKMAANKNLTFVANSELIRNHLQDIYNLPDDRVEVISNGIDMSYFDQQFDSKDVIKQRIGITSDLPIVTFVGSGYHRKGVFQLIEAIATERNLQAIIVGKDHQLNKARQIVDQRNLSHRIKLLGPKDDVLDILKITDIFCLPSLYDSFSNSALEAICMGIPVVATEFVGLGNEIFKANAGVQCTRDIDSIKESINIAYANQKIMSQNALNLSKNYDIKQITPSWLRLYKKILEKK
jgi:UDP-glucose:(heptosyl)LPS alpha-1,3-glucosyltransferase